MIQIILFVFFLSLLHADPADFKIGLSQGYRREKQDFSISGIKGSPNIVSELTFKDIDVYVTRLWASVMKDGYYLKGSGAYGKILDGRTIDNDYARDDRKGHFSHSVHDITGDYTADFRLQLGRSFEVIGVHVGYSAYLQRMRFKHGKVWTTTMFNGGKGKYRPVHGLNSTLKTNWHGPELGLELKQPVAACVDIIAHYSFLFPLRYEANGHWNLRKKHHRHFDMHNRSTKSFGNIFGICLSWCLSPAWSLQAAYEYLRFSSRGGHEKVGNVRVPMKKAHLTSQEVRLSLVCSLA